MQKFLKGAAIAALATFAMTSAASAAVVVSSSPGAPDPGPGAGQTKLITFDAGLPAGVTLSGDIAVVSGSAGGLYAEPAGDATPYITVPYAAVNGTGTLDVETFLAGQVSSFSFYWGSIDTYNTLELLNTLGNVIYTLNGGSIPPANGDQTLPGTNRRVNFVLTGADRNLGAIRFNSQGKAFESDTFAFAAVPEPATWAMMIAGFGLAGVAIRRRRQTLVGAVA
jgi:hypothetical protein